MLPIPIVTIWDSYRVARKRAGDTSPDFFSATGLKISGKGYYFRGTQYFAADKGSGYEIYMRVGQHIQPLGSPSFTTNAQAVHWLHGITHIIEGELR
jgi:hypothetical protein